MADLRPVIPLTHPPAARICVPGSKSLTNRALLLAALAGVWPSRDTRSAIHHALRSEDTEVMVNCLVRLGIEVRPDWDRRRINVTGCHGRLPALEADLDVGNSGTTLRFLTAAVALRQGRYRFDGSRRMAERPIGELFRALRPFGARVTTLSRTDPLRQLPFVLEAEGFAGGNVRIRGEESSQFLSGLLMAAPLAQGPVTIQVNGPLVSKPYVDMTLAVMRQFGVCVEQSGTDFHVPAPQAYLPREHQIEPDASAAGYFWAAAAITGGEVTVPDLGPDSLQGDVRFADILGRMGCEITKSERGITVRGRRLCGFSVDMNDISDCVPTLAAVACFADGPTTIRNVAHIRHKECNRLQAVATELRRLGAGVKEFADGLTIIPEPLHGARVKTYDDHRMAMSLALVGLRVPGVEIEDPGCVSKTYPTYFDDLERLRG